MEPKDIAMGFAKFVGVIFFLYFFLVSLDLMGGSFVILAGESAGDLFGAVNNPLAGLMTGILATVLVQSSSTTTSIVVSLVGAGVLNVTQGTYLIFGANIGTSVTNTIVSLAFITDRESMRRGFAGATVHDMFNYLNVLFWLPVEVIVAAITGTYGPLGLLAETIAESFTACDGDDCEKWEGPLKIVTGALSKLVISKNKDAVKDIAVGKPSVELCPDLFVDGADKGLKFNDKRCFKNATELSANALSKISQWCGEEEDNKKEKAQFKFCLSATETDAEVEALAVQHFEAYKMNKGGIFYENDISEEAAGWITLVLSLIALMVCLVCMVKLLSSIVQGQAEEWTKKVLNMNPYLGILFGAGLTIFVQSSSITTSVLTPLAAMGTITLETMLPMTLGANIGTTVTGILASLVGSSAAAFQVAMVHVLFNVFGVILFYPIPFIRAIPLAAARNLGNLAATFRAFPFFYLALLFFIYPGLLLAISVGFGSGSTGGIIGGVFGLIFFLAFHALFLFWYKTKGGRDVLIEKFGAKDEDFEQQQSKEGQVAPTAGEP